MGNWLTELTLLAQEAAPGGGGQGAGNGEGGLGFGLLPMYVAIGLLFYFFLLRPGQREKAQRETMLKALKKNDRVVTIGGIVGTIANIEPDGREVTLKVDDNTRIRFLKTSIQSVYTEEKTDDSSRKEVSS